jgi:hypothetical protein
VAREDLLRLAELLKPYTIWSLRTTASGRRFALPRPGRRSGGRRTSRAFDPGTAGGPFDPRSRRGNQNIPCARPNRAGIKDAPRDGSQNAWLAQGRRVDIGTGHGVGDAVIHAVILGFPAAAAVEAVIAACVLADAWPFERVPVKNTAVHGPVLLKSLPIGAGPQYDCLIADEPRHVFQMAHHQCGAGTNAVVSVQEITRVK